MLGGGGVGAENQPPGISRRSNRDGVADVSKRTFSPTDRLYRRWSAVHLTFDGITSKPTPPPWFQVGSRVASLHR